MAIKVTLRSKKISGNRQTLYLDFYPAIPDPETGKPTRREFLLMYILDNPNSINKKHNNDTLKLAELIRQRRENELNKPEIYSEYEKQQLRIKELGEQDFLEYFKKLRDKRKSSNYDNWVSAYHHLEKFSKGKLRFSDLNEIFGNDFREYLLTTKSNRSPKTKLVRNSASSYFNKFKSALKQAYKDGYLQTDLNAKIEFIKYEETRRNCLTLEELNALVKTECQNPLLKLAALFSALTGMRFSDIRNLTWGDIEYINKQGPIVHFQQQKTKGIEDLPIGKQAYALLGERKNPSDKVFEGLTYSAYQNRHLFQWIGAAGITKHITFHCFRHTFATLQLNKGTGIETVSKLLGHSNLRTTQIYAKLTDKTKRKATNRIKLDLESLQNL